MRVQLHTLAFVVCGCALAVMITWKPESRRSGAKVLACRNVKSGHTPGYSKIDLLPECSFLRCLFSKPFLVSFSAAPTSSIAGTYLAFNILCVQLLSDLTTMPAFNVLYAIGLPENDYFPTLSYTDYHFHLYGIRGSGGPPSNGSLQTTGISPGLVSEIIRATSG